MLREGLSRTVHNRIINMARADENRARLGMPTYKYMGYNRKMERHQAKALVKQKIEKESPGSRGASSSRDSEWDELDTYKATEDNAEREVRLFERMVNDSRRDEIMQTNLIRKKAIGFENSVLINGKYIQIKDLLNKRKVAEAPEDKQRRSLPSNRGKAPKA